MRRKARRQLRFVVVFLVACIVALVTGSTMALATGGGHGGGSTTTTAAEVCWVDQFENIDQEHGSGSHSHNYDVHGTTVTVTFSWTADKHLTASVSGGTFVRLYMKAGNHTFGPFTGAGPYSVYEDNPSENSDNGLALSHMNFCLLAPAATTTTTAAKGSLKITKTITGDNPQHAEFDDFSVTVTGPNNYSEHRHFNDSGEIVLSGLTPGEYSVTENAPGYPFSASGGGAVTVSSNQQACVSITNTGSTTTTTAAKGSLKISKTITGDNPDNVGFTSFYVTVTGPNNYSERRSFNSSGEILLSGLAPGEYTIDEDTPAYPFSVSGEGPVTVNSNHQTGATIVNTGRTTTTVVASGSLKITKTITGDNPDELGFASFYVTVTGPNNYSVYENFGSSGEIVLSGLAPGQYSIAEDTPVYPFSASGGGSVTVNSGQQTGATIINTGSTTTTLPPVGSLRITKTIAGDNPQDLGFEAFSVAVTGPAPGSDLVFNGSFDSSGEIVITGLAPGTYTVTEAALGYPWTISGDGTVDVVADQEALKAITNTGSTSTTLAVVTSNPTGTTLRRTGTIGRTTGTTVLGFNSTSETVMGWVAQPDNIQTGGGGMAGGVKGAWIGFGLAGMLLIAVIAISAVGVRHGTL
jgi:hypothetical protein